MISTATALTNQFYEWERRGRGWHIAPFPCDLEPEFVPFFGHFIEPGEIIDDGKQPSFWTNLPSGFKEPEKQAAINSSQDIAHPYSGLSGGLTVFTVTLPRHFIQNKDRIGQFLVMLSYRKSPVSFEIIGTDDEIILEWVTQDIDAGFFYGQIKAFFPECAIVETSGDPVLEIMQHAACIYTIDFGLSEECMRPIAANFNLEHDPYIPLFGILERLDIDDGVIIQILFCGVHNAWAESMQKAVADDFGKTSFFLNAPEMPQLTKDKVSKPLYGVNLRVLTVSDTMEQAAILLQHVATAVVHASTSSTNSLMPLQDEQYTVNMRLTDFVLRETHRVGMLLNASELATFVHFPAIISNKLIATTHTTKQAPLSLSNQAYVLGINEHQRMEQNVSISTDQRLRHIHILGATGTGKSTLIKSLMMQDIDNGLGMMCLDPHGDLIEDILENIPKERVQDVIMIDPHDAQYPIGLNILVAHSDIEKELLASDLVAVFRRFSTSWGDAMNSVFANAILAFMYNTKQYHLGDLRRFLIEAPYRTQILSTVTDSDIVYYWQHEFPILKSSSIGSILTRLDAFLRPRVIRNMVCQKQSLDFARLMDNNKIVLVKLSQGLLGTENSYLLGAFIVSKLQQTALSRQAQGIQDRIPFFCYIDEFQHFITPSMASILSGARKYGLGLVLSHQDMQQVSKYDSEIAGSVLANSGTRICFRLGDTDAKRLEGGFSSFTAADLQNLATGDAIARVNTIDADFNLAVVPYIKQKGATYIDEIIEHSRDKYSVPIVQTNSIAVERKPIAEVERAATPKEPITPIQQIDEVQLPKQESVREHRYLQTFVKAMAEAHGYKASLEVPTPDGIGLVDVLAEKGPDSIAIEISVTTNAQWELHNIRKCLSANYSKIIVCTSQSTKLKSIRQQIATHLAEHEQKKITVILSNDIQSLFVTAPQTQAPESLVKGYRVKVNYEPNATKQDLLRSIINATKKR